jgi:cell division protease FtsH
MTQRRDISEHTAQLVDQEVKRILDEAHQYARKVLEAEQELLESIAEALLERETLGRTDVELLAAGKPLPPQEIPEDVIPSSGSTGDTVTEPEGEVPSGDDPGSDAATVEPGVDHAESEVPGR